MKSKKLLSVFFIGLINILNSFAVQVITNPEPAKETVSEGFRNGVIAFFSIGIMILLGLGMVFLFVSMILKIQKKIKDINRSKKDFLYTSFLNNYNLLHNNRDKDLKYKKLKTLFLIWYREPVYVETKDGLKEIGFYDGETLKKEGFYMIGLYNKLGFFKVSRQIIIIPIKFKDKIVKKEIINKKKVLILKCEGLDEVGNTEFYLMPLIENPKKDKDILDFSDYIHKEFFEKTTLRDTIKENLLQYREGIIKGVEMNPNLQFKRRGE